MGQTRGTNHIFNLARGKNPLPIVTLRNVSLNENNFKINRQSLYTDKTFHDCPNRLKVTAPEHCGRSFSGRAPFLRFFEIT